MSERYLFSHENLYVFRYVILKRTNKIKD